MHDVCFEDVSLIYFFNKKEFKCYDFFLLLQHLPNYEKTT